MKHVLVIGGMRSIHKQLVKLGCKLTVICDSGRVIKRINNSDTEIYNRVIGLPPLSKDADFVEIAKSVNIIDKIDYIGCYQEEFQIIASKIAEELKLNYMKAEDLHKIYNKYELRKTLDEYNLSGISYEIVTNYNEIEKFINTHGYPVVLKPVTGTASNAVTIINNIHDIENAVQWFESSNMSSISMYVEEFIYGKEYSVEAVTFNGVSKVISVTEKYNDNIHCIELGHCVPAKLSDQDYNSIQQYTEKVLNILNIGNGVTHTELILTDSGPKIVETHFRVGGDNIPTLLNISSSIDLYEITAKCTINQNPLNEISTIYTSNKYACILYLNHEIDGTLEDVLGIDDAKKLPYVHELEIMKSKGSFIGKTNNSFSRTGYVICEGDSYNDAIQNAKNTLDNINILVKI